MAIEINYPDKIVPGVWQSYTITSDDGPPQGEIRVDGKVLDQRLIFMRDPLWKVTFKLPADSGGKTVSLKFHNGTCDVEDEKGILDGE